jgi:hypothetical protein
MRFWDGYGEAALNGDAVSAARPGAGSAQPLSARERRRVQQVGSRLNSAGRPFFPLCPGTERGEEDGSSRKGASPWRAPATTRRRDDARAVRATRDDTTARRNLLAAVARRAERVLARLATPAMSAKSSTRPEAPASGARAVLANEEADACAIAVGFAAPRCGQRGGED